MNTYKTGKAELGRSMVEMLGVLAIIGILTIGALVGYRQAMDKLHTNEVINEANTRAYTIATQLSMGIPINLSEFAGKSSVSGGNFGDDIQNWGGEFGIPVKDVPEAVCKKLIQTIGNTTALRAVTTMDNEKVTLTVDNCGESNSLYLVYNRDMAREEGDTSGRLSGGGSIHSSAGGNHSASSSSVGEPNELPICTDQICLQISDNYYVQKCFQCFHGRNLSQGDQIFCRTFNDMQQRAGRCKIF